MDGNWACCILVGCAAGSYFRHVHHMALQVLLQIRKRKNALFFRMSYNEFLMAGKD